MPLREKVSTIVFLTQFSSIPSKSGGTVVGVVVASVNNNTIMYPYKTTTIIILLNLKYFSVDVSKI